MQNTSKDTGMQFTTIRFQNQLMDAVREDNVTVDRLVAITINEEYNELVYTSGSLDVSTKSTLVLKGVGNKPALLTWCKVGSFIFFETTDHPQIKLSALDKLVTELGSIKDRRGNNASDIFLVGFGQTAKTIQYVKTPIGNIIRLSHMNGTGITSVRYDRMHRKLYAIINSNHAPNVKLVTLNAETLITNPNKIQEIDFWTVIDDNIPEPGILSLSRVKSDMNGVNFVVNMPNGISQRVNITMQNQVYVPLYGTPVHTPYMIIGNIWETNTAVGYLTKANTDIAVFFAPMQEKQDYLLAFAS